MQLRIPRAPRPVSLWQIPGAIRRVGTVCLVGGAIVVGSAVFADRVQRWLSEPARFRAAAQRVQGTIVRVEPIESMAGRVRVEVLYRFKDRRESATVEVLASVVEGLGKGASLDLLVDPANPSHPRELLTVENLAPAAAVGIGILVFGGLLASAGVAWSVRRAVRREVEPLRTGALVWLTLDPIDPSRRTRELEVSATYMREDVKHSVVARINTHRSAVRHGDKMLGAVSTKEPGFARVVDEVVARRLGWM